MELDIDTFLKKWDETKMQIKLLENKLEKYKKVVDKIILNDEGMIQSSEFVLLKKKQVRRIISKNTVPVQIWDNYSKNIEYSTYYIKKKK